MLSIKLSSDIVSQNIIYLATTLDDVKSYFSEEEFLYLKENFKSDKLLSVESFNQYKGVCIVDTDKERATINETIRKTGSQVANTLNAKKLDSAQFVNLVANSDFSVSFVEGVALTNYRFNKYFTQDEEDKQASLKNLWITDKNFSETQLNEVRVLIQAIYKTRDLVNEPVSFLTATQLAEEFKKMGAESGFSVEVFGKKKIESLKMGGLLAVNRGSQDPPSFTIMEWKPQNAKNTKPVVLVGKGVVFDTGGLSLKPTAGSMDEMKSDMAGAATVGGIMYAVAANKLPVWVIGLAPATDNRPGETAYAPQDVITMHNGMTVEVLNTDAEGRMILADALSYANHYKPQLVIDMATLTGAAHAAIGHYATVGMHNTKSGEFSQLQKTGDEIHERLVEFPFWDDYADLLKSDIADMKNIGGRIGGAITAGKFLEKFTEYPYIHLDIAGTAYITTNEAYMLKGGTGVGVRLLYYFLKSF